MSVMLAASVMAQSNKPARDVDWEENHASDALKWLQHFMNPTNEPNYDSLRQIGYEQLVKMDNHPAMTTLSSSSWMQVATSQDAAVSGRGACIAFDPGGAIYYGVAKGGLWKTTDGGTDWISMSDTWIDLDVGGVAVDPENPTTIYAGTGTPSGQVGGGGAVNGVGVYRSTDGGLNWTLLSSSPKVATTQMEVNPASSKLVYVAYDGGLSLSDDGGTTWKNSISLNGFASIVFDPHNAAIMYVAGGGAIDKSIDSGNTWTALPSGYPTGVFMVLGMSGVSSDSIYLSTGDGNGTLALSTDAGNTWTIKSSSLDYLGQQSEYANAMAVDPRNSSNVIVGGLDIYSSTVGGSGLQKNTDWTDEPTSSKYAHADIHYLKYDPYVNPPVLYAMTDGGVYHSGDFGGSWHQDMNKSLGTFSFVGGDMTVNNSGTPDFFCAGAQDNGLSGYTFGVDSTYRSVQGGDGGTMFISPADGQTMYGTYVYYTLYKSQNRGIDWSQGGAQNILGNAILTEAQNNPNLVPFYITYDVYDQDPGVVAVCGPINLYLETQGNTGPAAFPQSTNVAGSSASDVSGNVVAVNIASSDDDYIYIGTSGNYFYYSTDVGQTWTPSYQTGSTTKKMGFSGTPQGITTDPNNSQNVYMAVSNGGDGTKHFFYSNNGGLSWTAPATNLPALNYHRIAMDPNGILYIGDDFGVLRSGDTGKTWYPVAAGLPTALVTSLQVRGNYLVAGTYGRGMYYVDLTQLGPIGPLNGVAASTPAPSTSAAITAVYPSIIMTSTPSTTVDYTVSTTEQATLAVYDVLGRQERVLVNQFVTPGDHQLAADLSGLATGQHYLMLTAGGTSVTKPIVIE